MSDNIHRSTVASEDDEYSRWNFAQDERLISLSQWILHEPAARVANIRLRGRNLTAMKQILQSEFITVSILRK